MKRQEAAQSPHHTFAAITWGESLVSSETQALDPHKGDGICLMGECKDSQTNMMQMVPRASGGDRDAAQHPTMRRTAPPQRMSWLQTAAVSRLRLPA